MMPLPFLMENGYVNVFKGSSEMKNYDTDMALDEYEARCQELVSKYHNFSCVE